MFRYLEATLSTAGERWHRLATRSRRFWIEKGGFRWLVLFCSCALVELGYVFVASAGKFSNWPSYNHRVDDLAEGFRAGHLHTLVEPPAALVSAKDPLDPANSGLWMWDNSFYKGHFYQYFGPVPALLLAAAKTAFRISETLGDEVITFALASLQLLAGAVLLERLARRLFGVVPIGLVALAVLAFGLASPTPFILARQAMYEAAIVGGHAFVLLGIALAFEATSCVALPCRSLAFAVGAGIAWSFALGSRISLAPALPFLIVVTAVAMAWQRPSRWKHLAAGLVALGAPLALSAFGLLAYNKARFERWFEFGMRFQMTWLELNFSPTFVPANVYSYAFRPAEISCKFPFVFTNFGQSADASFPPWLKPAPSYEVYEPVAGVFFATPFAWLWVPAFAVLGWRLWRGRRAKHSVVSLRLLWLFLALWFGCSLTFVVPLFGSGATMRYLGDAAPAFMLLTSLAAFATYDAIRRVAPLRFVFLFAFAVAAISSAAAGLALGFSGYYQHFKQNNPALLQRLEARYSVCAPDKH
jgi:hypothetical protein